MRSKLYLLAVMLFTPTLASGGTYLFSLSMDPFIINHSPTYSGTPGQIQLGVCLDANAADLRSSVDWMIKTWNAMRPAPNNCEGPPGACVIADAVQCIAPACTCGQIPFPPDTYPCLPHTYNAGSVLLHEFGHCAFGLGHNNWIKNNGLGATTSRTSTKDATAINEPVSNPDNVPGSRDDRPTPFPGSRVTHWFRVSDNDPFLIDNTAMDSSTFSRDYQNDLPPGSTWPASANIRVAGLLGAGRSQSIMVSIMGGNTDYLGPVADDVNTIRFAFAGQNPDLGQTSDDYTVQLYFEEFCSLATFRVRWLNFTDGTLGLCHAENDALPEAGHYVMVPLPVFGNNIVISLDKPLETDEFWRFMIATDGFETGDFIEWSAVVP